MAFAIKPYCLFLMMEMAHCLRLRSYVCHVTEHKVKYCLELYFSFDAQLMRLIQDEEYTVHAENCGHSQNTNYF